MKLVKQQSTTNHALRVLITAADDADGIEFALAAATEWLDGRMLVVVNATGKDLAGYAKRYDFSVVCDDAGRPSRSLAEISECFETIDRADVGAVVVLDTNRIYRATRCSVRDIDAIKSLSPGHWDDTNESLGRATEQLTRAGIPSIFVAPPSDVYGAGPDGDPVVVGQRPQAWKDLPRQAHAMLVLSADGATVTLDDHRVLPKRVDGGVQLGAALADLARNSSPGAGGTTLAEATAAELAARARLAARRREASEQQRDRLVALAELRAHQGPDAWSAHVQEATIARAMLLPDDADVVDQALARVHSTHGRTLEWMRQAERVAELSPYGLHVSLDGAVAGPEPSLVPKHEAVDAAALLDAGTPPTLGGKPFGLIVSLAKIAGVWDPVPFSSVCSFAIGERVRFRGPNWDDYPPHELQALAMLLWQLAFVARHYSGRPPEAQPPAVEPPARVQEAPQADPGDWPSPTEFAAWADEKQRNRITGYLDEIGAYDDWEAFRRGHPDIGKSKSLRRWSPDERNAIYRAAYARRPGRLVQAA